jgi:hypothetical protein
MKTALIPTNQAKAAEILQRVVHRRSVDRTCEQGARQDGRYTEYFSRRTHDALRIQSVSCRIVQRHALPLPLCRVLSKTRGGGHTVGGLSPLIHSTLLFAAKNMPGRDWRIPETIPRRQAFWRRLEPTPSSLPSTERAEGAPPPAGMKKKAPGQAQQTVGHSGRRAPLPRPCSAPGRGARGRRLTGCEQFVT